jgi:hypothetical protein
LPSSNFFTVFTPAILAIWPSCSNLYTLINVTVFGDLIYSITSIKLGIILSLWVFSCLTTCFLKINFNIIFLSFLVLILGKVMYVIFVFLHADCLCSLLYSSLFIYPKLISGLCYSHNCISTPSHIVLVSNPYSLPFIKPKFHDHIYKNPPLDPTLNIEKVRMWTGSTSVNILTSHFTMVY